MTKIPLRPGSVPDATLAGGASYALLLVMAPGYAAMIPEPAARSYELRGRGSFDGAQLLLQDLYAESGVLSQDTSSHDKKRLERLEQEVDSLRTLLRIPGMSAVIIKDQKVLWAKGLGFADVEGHVPATPETVYHIASFTKTFAATLIMQLVEQGKLDPDVLEGYVGQYKFETFDRIVTVSREGARLFIDIPRTSRSELFPEAEATFFFKAYHDVEIRFERDGRQATHLDYVESGEAVRAARIK